MSPGERTPEERERARLEREARRAAREGRPPPEALPPVEQPPPEARPPVERPQAEQPPVEQPPAAPVRRARQPAPEPGPPQQPVPPDQPPPYEATPPGRRSARAERPAMRARAARGAAARSAATRELLRRRRPSAAGPRGSRLRGGVVPLAALAVVFVALAWFLLSLFQPFKSDGGGEVRVVIPKGAGVGKIAHLLADRGVVSSAFFFEARATVSGRRGDLKPGTFVLKKGMSHTEALDALAKGPPPDIVRITVPEGRARREVKAIVGHSLRGDYLAVTRRSSVLDPRRYGAKRARDLEGFLFPATYELKRGKPTGDLVAQQLQALKRQIGRVDLRAARRKNLTPYDVITIASMIEREAQVARERPLVASVIYNRLKQGIPLGIDATIRFVTNNWTKPLTQSQLAVASPYNTRTRKGLPPGPIGSPGLAAIRAAARPARTGFLFYVVKPGGCGQHDFSKTDAEFQRDVARYNRERARRGGKSPTNCR